MNIQKTEVKPVGDYILYEIVSAERKTEAGLVLPGIEDAGDPVIGNVLAVGQKVDLFKAGEKILLARGVSTKVPTGGVASKDFALLVDQKHILAKVG